MFSLIVRQIDEGIFISQHPRYKSSYSYTYFGPTPLNPDLCPNNLFDLDIVASPG